MNGIHYLIIIPLRNVKSNLRIYRFNFMKTYGGLNLVCWSIKFVSERNKGLFLI